MSYQEGKLYIMETLGTPQIYEYSQYNGRLEFVRTEKAYSKYTDKMKEDMNKDGFLVGGWIKPFNMSPKLLIPNILTLRRTCNS